MRKPIGIAIVCMIALGIVGSTGSQLAETSSSSASTPAPNSYSDPGAGADPDPNSGADPDPNSGADADPNPGADAPLSDTLTVRFIDVGQGDCALVTCGSQALLIDGGPSKTSSKIYTILKNLDIAHLDAIIATHPDADHIGGIPGALNYAACSMFYCSVTSYDSETFDHVVKYLGDTPITVPSAGDAFCLGAATVTFVGPASSEFAAEGDSNNSSLVCRIDYGTTSFLFAGDAEKDSESAMVAAHARLDADVLKVAHHGSASSSSAAFLDAVSPAYAVISVGDNAYGHPTQEALDRIAATGAQLFRTDEDGSVVFTSDGTTISVYTTTGYIEK